MRVEALWLNLPVRLAAALHGGPEVSDGEGNMEHLPTWASSLLYRMACSQALGRAHELRSALADLCMSVSCIAHRFLLCFMQKKDCRQRLRERWDAERLGGAAELERRLAECAVGLRSAPISCLHPMT